MARRLSLHPAERGPAPLPTVDAVRKQLGGRASTEPGAGEVVRVGAEGDRTGVVLFVHGEQLDVWLSGDRVQRVRRADTHPAGGVAPRELAAIAGDARAFADLREGQRVAFLQEGRRGEGALVEKCRFGGLVELRSGTVVGVGFRRFITPS